MNGVAFSSDGKLLASANGDTTIGLWNPVTGQASGGFSGRKAVAFSPDGTLLATADTDGIVRLWDLATRQAASAPLPADPGGSVLGVAFSPDGTLLATADTDGRVRLWDLATRRAAGAPLPADPGGSVLAVAFSPDGRLLASADGDGTVRLWNPGNGQPVGAPLPAVTSGGVNGVAFSPDGKLLAAAYSDGNARLWNLASRQAVGVPLPAGAGRGGACPAWPSALTASSWPPPTLTAPCGCGKCRFSLTRTQHSVPMSAHQQRQNGRITPRANRSPACADDTCRFRPVPAGEDSGPERDGPHVQVRPEIETDGTRALVLVDQMRATANQRKLSDQHAQASWCGRSVLCNAQVPRHLTPRMGRREQGLQPFAGGLLAEAVCLEDAKGGGPNGPRSVFAVPVFACALERATGPGSAAPGPVPKAVSPAWSGPRRGLAGQRSARRPRRARAGAPE